VDESYNTSRYNPHQKYPYLTVFFYSTRIDELPNPKFIGDIIYLRRYASLELGSPSDTTTTASRDTTSTTTTAPGLSSTEIPIRPILKPTKLPARIPTLRTKNTRTSPAGSDS
jgi:hypothetical protein